MCLTIHLGKITRNARKAVDICRSFGLDVVGVTKAVWGHPGIARAMLEGGIDVLGDSRLDNISRMREAGIRAPTILLRSPAPSEVSRCIALADASLNGDLQVMRALSREAIREAKTHKVILMVDFDTGREGVYPDDVPGVCREVMKMEGLELVGLGIYFSYGSDEGLHVAGQQRLVSLAIEIEQDLGTSLPIISGGSTNVFHDILLEGKHVPGINQLRIGTAILLGISSSIGPARIEGFYHDTFTLEAELIGVKKRTRVRGLLSVGQMDTDSKYLFPIIPGVRIIESSCDHIVVDLTEYPKPVRTGDHICFELGYYALSRLMISPYVKMTYKENCVTGKNTRF